ncbi:DUF3626 domain-containing protein [Streptomyces arboris]|uniref:DUF3626 domain-containing protein n=1 Tax=Streptomyces arboris TaxID=2600619 RepID=A0A5N5EQ43_9ACTN|nr:DUF3626 domain-containing protein [Streptomyces arboris]KAB2593078.1 DUF3626 domain-containing protein [Streptomyces arboris]
MNTALPPGPARRRAWEHVAALSSGAPLDAGLRVTLNFHPDRTVAGRPVLERLGEDGLYVSQFVTGTSNGGLTAHPGGDRWRWESRMFGARMSGLVELAAADRRDALDDYIEAQIHTPVRLDRDVEALVLDPAYRGTAVEAAAGRLPCPVEWHGGFRLCVEELRRRPGFRGPAYVELGAALAVDGCLDARIIGDAARAGRHAEQDLKKVWHLLARFGRAPVVLPAGG